jgi:hypothetical protein
VTSSADTQPASDADKPRPSKRRRFRDFVTSTAGIATGIATIVTAAATIAGVVSHLDQPRQEPVATPPARTTAAPSPATSSSSVSPARVQWGPGSLLLTNNGTDLSSVPPGNQTSTVGDVYVSGGISPFAGTVLVLWTRQSQPTAQQCKNLATTQGEPGQAVNVVPGSVVCAITAEGPVAIIRVESIDQGALTIETRTTVWDLPGSLSSACCHL